MKPILLVQILALSLATPALATTYSWSGGGPWSYRFAWSPLPPFGSTAAGDIAIGGPTANLNQDCSPYPVLTSLTFGGSYSHTVQGLPLRMASGATIVSNSRATQIISSELQLSGPLTVNVNYGADPTDLAFYNLTGTGSLVVNSYQPAPIPTPDTYTGIVTIGSATYTGTTTINSSAILRVGGSLSTYPQPPQSLVGQTSNQGSYSVAGVLAGSGTIGLAPNAEVRIHSGGHISPGGGALPPDPCRLVVNGPVVFESGSSYDVEALVTPQGSTPDFLGVNGTLDLSASGDKLVFDNFFVTLPYGTPTPPIVIASYQNRIGSFDTVIDLAPAYMLTYTSAENAGPGQIVVVPVPLPPAALAALPLLATVPFLRRRR